MKKCTIFIADFFTKWCQTDIDGIFFMDDWGSQKSLLINPEIWIKIFKPIYKDFIEIAHKYGKKAFMHSDGNTIQIIPHMIDLGLDAINVQIFCIGIENLKQFKGKITFWGEIDRQYLLPHGTKKELEYAVNTIYNNLWDKEQDIIYLAKTTEIFNASDATYGHRRIKKQLRKEGFKCSKDRIKRLMRKTA